jgi:hypothetical protein
MKLLHAALLAGLAFMLSCTGNKVAGTVSDTDTGIMAMLCNLDGTPAVGAVVKFFKPENTVCEYNVTTDTNGRYPTKGLAKGLYNIWAEKDSLVAFQYSTFISDDTNYIHQDTLRQPGSISGTVGVQPTTDSRTVTVQVLGTEVYSGVDEYGNFTLKRLAEGEYSIRLTTTEPDYSPTFSLIRVTRGKSDTLSTIIELTYTGIPVVLGLFAFYDTLNGLVTVHWQKATYKNLQDFVIYKDTFDAVTYSKEPIAARSDTFFTDQVFNRALAMGAHSFSDTNDYHLKYRVAIRSTTNKIGSTYRYVDITAASPTKVAATFTFSSYHIAKELKIDSASINDPVLFLVQATNPTRPLKQIVWADIQTGNVVRTRTLDTVATRCEDTISCQWSQLGRKGLECTATDNAGTSWKDTAYVSIVKDAPKIKLSTAVSMVSIYDSIKYSIQDSDFFGKIVKYEIGQAGYSATFKPISGVDSFYTSHGIPDNGFYLAVRVTDDDGNTAQDSVLVRVIQDPPTVVLDTGRIIEIGKEITLTTDVRQFFGKIVAYKMDFEGDSIWDDTGSVLHSFDHTYSKGGVYRPVLQVTDDDGNVTAGKGRILVATLVPTSTTSPSIWTYDKSPYYIQGNFNSPYAITIEPGVEIRLSDGRTANFGGALRAIGTKEQPILFTTTYDSIGLNNSRKIVYESTEPLLLDSNGQYISGSVMEHCILKNMPFHINNYASLYMSQCTIKDNYYFGINNYGHLYLINSEIIENRGVGLTLAEASSNCGISEAWIRNCTIARNNAEGIKTNHVGAVNLTYCNITENKGDGISVGTICGISMSNCNVFNNLGFQIRRSYSGDIHVDQNYWGTNDELKMRDLIYDKNDDQRSGEVFFSPILTSPVPDVGPKH